MTVYQSISQATQEVRTLYDIAQTLGTRLSVDDTMGLLTSKLNRLVPASCWALYLPDPRQDVVRCRYASGLSADSLEGMTIPAGEGVSGWAARHHTAAINARSSADFDAAIKIVPEKPDYYRVRAQYRYGQDKFEEALADVDKALELEQDHAASIELRGLILLGLKKYDEALASFNKASELAPEAVLPHQHLGEVYRQKGDLKKALEQLTKALELAPDGPDAKDIKDLLKTIK